MIYIGQGLTALDYTGCLLKWNPSNATDLEGYSVYMKEGDLGVFEKMTDVLLDIPQWESPPLRLDMTYYFYVTATDLSGNESAPSGVYAFHLSDATPDPTVVVINPFNSVHVQSGTTLSQPVTSQHFLTRFTLGGSI